MTTSKQKKIINAAGLWLMLHKNDLQPRFDVIEILAPENDSEEIKINLYENAY